MFAALSTLNSWKKKKKNYESHIGDDGIEGAVEDTEPDNINIIIVSEGKQEKNSSQTMLSKTV